MLRAFYLLSNGKLLFQCFIQWSPRLNLPCPVMEKSSCHHFLLLISPKLNQNKQNASQSLSWVASSHDGGNVHCTGTGLRKNLQVTGISKTLLMYDGRFCGKSEDYWLDPLSSRDWTSLDVDLCVWYVFIPPLLSIHDLILVKLYSNLSHVWCSRMLCFPKYLAVLFPPSKQKTLEIVFVFW